MAPFATILAAACVWFALASPVNAIEEGAITAFPTSKIVTARQLIDDPNSFFANSVIVRSLGCVSDPKKGFVCVTTIDGRMLRLRATVLGSSTGSDIAYRLIRGCKGTGNIDRRECRFDAYLKPASVETAMIPSARGGEMPTVEVYSNQIDFAISSGSSRTR